MTRDNVHPIRPNPFNRISVTHPDERWRQTDDEQIPMGDAAPTVDDLLRDFDTLCADLALDNPDLEPGYHAAISNVRNRYRTWLAHQAGHPSTGPGDGGAA